MDTSFLMSLIVPLIGGLFTAAKSIRFVQEGEKGIKLRFGKAVKDKEGEPKVIEPGFVFLIPFVETLQRRHVRQQTLSFVDQVILTADNMTFRINAVVIFKVTDVYSALFEIHELDQSIEDLGMGILRDIVSKRKHDNLSDTEEIAKGLLEKIKERADSWGVDFMQFKLIDCAPTPETASLVVAKTGALLRTKALKEAAAKLDFSLETLPPEIAASLIGVPMITTINSPPARVHTTNEQDAPEGSLADKLLS